MSRYRECEILIKFPIPTEGEAAEEFWSYDPSPSVLEEEVRDWVESIYDGFALANTSHILITMKE